MIIKKIKSVSLISFLIFGIANLCFGQYQNNSDRQQWINILTKIANPVITHLSNEQLHLKMPIETNDTGKNTKRSEVTHLEAFGRLIAGMAPWLELGADKTTEGQLRKKYIQLSLKCLKNAVNPNSPDFMNFTVQNQPLVDAAFLAHALVRAPKTLWNNLDDSTKENLITAFKSTRRIKPGENNWLLFSAMIETALFKFTNEWESDKVEYAVNKHLEWYKGDGIYGDGPNFHWDYYNSFVIQPMLIDILKICKEKNHFLGKYYELILTRAQRYAVIQERLISPEGTYPPIGRSLAYRVGAFQLLGQIALMKKLPKELKPGQVRSALTSIIKKTMLAKKTFDKNGWLKIGMNGSQTDIGENYISTGSLYLCSVGFLPLGLVVEDEFWSSPYEDWTSKKIWNGINIKADHALKD